MNKSIFTGLIIVLLGVAMMASSMMHDLVVVVYSSPLEEGGGSTSSGGGTPSNGRGETEEPFDETEPTDEEPTGGTGPTGGGGTSAEPVDEVPLGGNGNATQFEYFTCDTAGGGKCFCIGTDDCVKMVLSGQCKDKTWKPDPDGNGGECDWNV